MISTNNSPRSKNAKDSEFTGLLVRARAGDRDSLGRLLQWYANYLNILASTQLDRRLRRRLNPSDIVQETMLAAHKDFGDFRGRSQGELLCWLRTILINTLHRSFTRNIKVEKRDIRREISIDEVSNRLDQSGYSLAAVIPDRGQSPSTPMQAQERAVEIANQLSKLKPQYRDVIVLRVLQGLAFEDIAQRMNRTGGAVRMLWLRALEAIKTKGDAKDGSLA